MTTASPFKQTTPKQGEGAQYEMPPAGTHPACLVGIIDLGTHPSTFGGGKVQWKRKVCLIWELIGVEMTGFKGRHFLLSENYTNSLNEKAKLRNEVIKPWRGKDLTEGEEFDLGKMLGKKCLLSVSHDTNKNTNKTYAGIASIAAVPKTMQVGEPQNQPVLWFIGCGEDLPDWLPRLYGREIKEIVNESREQTGGAEKPAPGNGSPSGGQEGGEEIPF